MSQTVQSKKRASNTQNIKVVVRVRPLNKEELEKRVKSLVSCISLREIQTKDKKYLYDRVFTPDSSQMDVYSYVVAPMISDVLEGYNCTVFAYGQTGTGKTHTMTSGDPTLSSNVHWKNDELAGCIPRAAANIFDEIGLMDAVDYNVRVSFLELYNEEVRDLLSEEERPSPLNIFNDSKGSVYIQGLNEITVFNSQDIYVLLQKGTVKRQTASTLMNNHSSRSHTVFTITVHTREVTITGEDVLKSGKINLVDLAGSENIAKSGAKDKRAQELANINRSLLTLGRVIQILAEKNNKHVPYRDSKLTRILQDSLGGHTKTCIIATVSPSSSSYEETQSTLEYASRARDIRNTPTINEKVTKQQMIKDMSHEIEKLKKDLDAARTGTGVYIDQENWEQLNSEIQSTAYTLTLKNEIIDDMKRKLGNLETIRDTKIKEFDQIMNVCKKKDKIINKAKTLLGEMKVCLKQEEYVSNYYAVAATETNQKAKELLEATMKLTNNQEILQKKLENQYYNNYTNEKIIKEKGDSLAQNISSLLQEEETLKDITSTTLGNMKSNLISMKVSQTYILDSMKTNFAIQSKSLVEHVVESELQIVSNATENVKSVISQSQSVFDELLGVTSSGKECCSSASSKFERYNKKSTEKINSASVLLTNMYERLKKQKQNEENLLQDLERFTDITKNRISELDGILTLVEDSNVLELDKDTEMESQKTEIENELSKIQENNEIMSNRLQGQKKLLESHLGECDTFTANVLSNCKKCKEKIVEIENSNVNTLESHKTTLESQINQTRKDAFMVEQQINDHVAKANTLLNNMDGILTQDIISGIIPVKRGGDTPKQNNLNLPKRVSEGTLSRDVLVKRFKEEFAENIENESILLNVSTDSIHPLEEEPNEDNSENRESLECTN